MENQNDKSTYRDARHEAVYQQYKDLLAEVRQDHGELSNEVTKNWYWNTLSERLPFRYSPETIKKIVYDKMKEERSR